MDNWTLQNAGELLHERLSGQMTQELSFSGDGQSFSYVEISQDVVALECLCQLLHNIVFAEELLVDARFTSSWEEFASIAVLTRERVLTRKPFTDVEAQWEARRETMADQLCFCPAVRQRHEQNKEEYAAQQQSGDQMLAQLVWGGAGMLARADYFRVPYAAHPLRERLLARARVLSGPTRAAEQLRRFIETQRMKLYQRIDESGIFAQVNLPPVVIEIATAASTLDDLVPAALQVRAKYGELRGWLTEFQTALDAEDIGKVLSRRRVLESVGRNIDDLSTIDPGGDTSMQLGVDWPTLNVNISAYARSLTSRFGIRAQIKRLVLAPAGLGSFRRLLGLLGEEHTRRGATLQRDFLTRQGLDD